jgi:hypothetical protein
MEKQEIETIILERLKWEFRNEVSEEFLSFMDLETTKNVMHSTLTMALKGFVWKRSFPSNEYTTQDRSVSFPTTWLDALKDRWLPKCFRRYFKINYTEIACSTRHVIEHTHVCPHLNVKSESHHLRFMMPINDNIYPEK